MSTPKVTLLPSKLLNKTLSAKKKPLKTIKNVLSSKELDWPIFENSNELYEELLAVLSNPEPNSSMSGCNPDLRKNLLFGVKQIGRYITKEECCAMLFDKETPRMLISHLMHIATEKNIPAFLVPGLKSFLNQSLGFKCSSFCFKAYNKQFSKIIELIRNEHEKNSDALPNNSVTMDTSYKFTSSQEKMDDISIPTEEEKMEIEMPSFVVYLPRPENGKRAFNPPSSKTKNNKKTTEVSKSDFIKLEEGTKIKEKRKGFKPVYVKRIQNNTNRKSKKRNK